MLNCENCHHFDTLIDWDTGIWYRCLMEHMFDCDGKHFDPIHDYTSFNYWVKIQAERGRKLNE